MNSNIWAKTTIFDARFWSSPQKTRLVLDISQATSYLLKNSEKQVILTLKNINLPKQTFDKLQNYSDSRIKDIRLKREKSDLTLHFYKLNVSRISDFTLGPNSKYKHNRLVIDLYGKQVKESVKKSKKPQQKIIMVDAGHGGDDPGAIGYNGSYEKNVTLAIAKKLAIKINQLSQYKSVLTRSGDYYISLASRVRLAQKSQVNLFISIHADSVNNHKINGTSIYILSNKGASTKFAKRLEKSENAADKFGGVSSKYQDQYLNEILWDFSRSNRGEQNEKLANQVLKNIKNIGKLHQTAPQKAGFIVLKTPAIPSILIETAFISNIKDERRLNNATQQDKIASAILAGIQAYYKHQK